MKSAKNPAPGTPDAAGLAGARTAARPGRAGATSSGWRWPGVASVIAVVALLGLGLGMYPTVAAWYTQVDQSRVISNSVARMDDDPAANAEALRLAH